MRLLLYPVLALLLTSCATVFSGTTQTINVKAVYEGTSEIAKNAKCIVTDGQGVQYHVSNPGSVSVAKGTGSLQVQCSEPGYKQGRVGYGQNFNAISFVNVLFWPGFIVDAVTGSMHKYPSHAVVELVKE